MRKPSFWEVIKVLPQLLNPFRWYRYFKNDESE